MSFLAANSASSFVVELSTYNKPHEAQLNEDADGCIPCVVTFDSSEAILPDTSGFSVAVLGWSISTGESLCFTEPEVDEKTGDPIPIITYFAGDSHNEDGVVTHVNRESETRYLNEKTHNFSSMCDLLTSKHADMKIMHPTAGGGLIFTNDKEPGSASSDLDYKGINFSKRFCDRFRLHNAPIIRNRDKIVQLHPHLFEVVNYCIDYVRNIETLATTECVGVVSSAITAGDQAFSMTLNQQLWPNPVDGNYVYHNIEFSIRDDDFFDDFEIDGRCLAHTVAITVAGGIFSAALSTNESLPEISINTKAVFEHPAIKEMFTCLHDAFCPEVPCQFDDDNKQLNLLVNDFNKLLNGLTLDDFQRLPFIVCEKNADAVERMSGYTAETHSDRSPVINSRRAHIYDKALTGIDMDGMPCDVESDEVSWYQVTWEEVFIGPQKQGGQEVGDIEDLNGVGQIRFCGHPPARNEFFKPFEEAYLLNYGRNFDESIEPFLSTSEASFSWAGIDWDFDLAGRSRFQHCLWMSTEFFQFWGPDGEGHPDTDWAKFIGEKALKNLTDKFDKFPGAIPLDFEDFLATKSNTRTVEVDPILATHVTNSVFTITFEYMSLYSSLLYTDYGHADVRSRGQSGIYIRTLLTDDQKLSFKQHTGQVISLQTTDGSDINVNGTNLGIYGNTLVVHVPLASGRDWTALKSGFSSAGDEKEFKLTLGVEGNHEDDLYHTIRTQGLTSDDEFTVSHNRDIRLYPGDYIKSLAQADDQMLYSRLAITSQDLLVQPVISQGFRSLLLHSFPLPHKYSAQVDRNFKVTGMGSGIPGTLSWRDRGGEAIVHPIQMGSASLRHFSISAALKPRDSSSISSKQIMLPRGGIFEVTLIFLKDFSAK